MKLFDICREVMQAIEGAELENTVIIKAFPYKDKPVRLNKTVISVKPEALELDSSSIGGEQQYGVIKITATVYTPVKFGTDKLCEITEAAVNAVLPLMPSEISASPIKAEDSLGCLVCSCRFTFRCYIEEETE